jgi:hypothetical protein
MSDDDHSPPPHTQAWIVPQFGNLYTYVAGPLLDAIQSAALGGGQSSPFSESLAAVAPRVRAEVQGCVRNYVSATPLSVPPDLLRETCLLIIEAMQARVPGLNLTEDMRTQVSRAYDYLKRVSRCEVPIAVPPDPLTPQDVQKGGPIEVVHHQPRKFTAEKLNGL